MIGKNTKLVISILDSIPLGYHNYDLCKLHILTVLIKTGGNRSETARQTGLSLRTIRNKIAELRLDGVTHEVLYGGV